MGVIPAKTGINLVIARLDFRSAVAIQYPILQITYNIPKQIL